jgi:PEP-CTERM motif
MTNRLRSFLLAGAASLGLGAVAPAYASSSGPPPVPNPSEFVFVESPGEYTIINNSLDWYIWAFDVTNPAAASGSNPSTTQPGWVASDCNDNCGSPSPGFQYNNINGAYSAFGDDVGPGQTSSLFFFSAPEASSPTFYYTNGANIGTFTPTGSVPEPSTWAMLIAGFGFLGWRYGLERGGLKRLFAAA